MADPSADYYKAKWLHARAGWRYMEHKRNQWRALAKRLRTEPGRDGGATTSAANHKQGAPSVRSAICAVFGAYCSQAIRVVDCETGGTFSVYARNGQYLGLFQMGSYARARYGHSWTALGQARAAYRYFRDSGSDWSPWTCKP